MIEAVRALAGGNRGAARGGPARLTKTPIRHAERRVSVLQPRPHRGDRRADPTAAVPQTELRAAVTVKQHHQRIRPVMLRGRFRQREVDINRGAVPTRSQRPHRHRLPVSDQRSAKPNPVPLGRAPHRPVEHAKRTRLRDTRGTQRQPHDDYRNQPAHDASPQPTIDLSPTTRSPPGQQDNTPSES